MAILINDNYSLQGIKPFDARYLNISTPWASCAAAIAGIPTYRYSGLTVNIAGTEYWWKDGITNGDLIEKESSIGSNAITGATNGLTKIGQNVKFGGALTGNTNITGSYTLTANVTTLNLSGVSTTIGGTLTLGTTPSGSGEILCRDVSNGEIKITSLSSLGGITGGTNGLSNCGSQEIGLGGTLCANTQVSGTQTLTLGDLNGICLSAANGNDIAVNAKSNGGIYMKSQSGTLASSSDFTNAVGIVGDFDNTFKIHDNRAGSNQTGIIYAANYATNYVERSLVDKYYVDSVASGLDPKSAVLVATIANIVLSGTSTIDGVSLSADDRILVKNQTSGATNGIYVVSSGTWSRATDFDGTPVGEVTEGALIPVLSGSTNINSSWILITKDPITIGTTTLEFTKFSQLLDVAAGAGIAIGVVGETNTVCVNLGADSGLNTSSGLVIDSSIASTALTFSDGLLSVNVASCGSVGAIPVGYNAGDCLIVACSDIDSALGCPINTANNGLTKVGSNVVLGGALTGATTITISDGDSLTFIDSRTTPTCGIEYGGDYRGGFQNNTLITKQYADACDAVTLSSAQSYADGCDAVTLSSAQSYADGCDAAVSAATLTCANNYTDACVTSCTITANNGLTKSGTNIHLGGTLTGNTTIVGGTNDFCITNSSGNIILGNTGDSYVVIKQNGDYVCLGNSAGGKITTTSTSVILEATNVCVATTPANGSSSDSVLVWNSTDKIVKKLSGSELGEDNNRYNVDVVTSNITLPTSGYTILVSGASTVTLPSGVDGMAYKIKDAKGDALTNNISVVGTIDGGANAIINTDYGALELVYSSTLSEWYSLAFIN